MSCQHKQILVERWDGFAERAMYSNMIGEIRMTVQNMRKAKDMIRGDGFGRAGYLKSEFKKPSAA